MTALFRLVLVGCGGHASDVLSVIEACNEETPRYVVLGYLDDDPHADDRRVRHRGVSRLGCVADRGRLDGGVHVLGIGYPRQREAVAVRLKDLGEAAEAIVHPRAVMATGVALECGVVIFDGAHVGPLARISEAAMIGRGAIVGHDSLISPYASVMPGAVVSGDCSVGVGALLGTNATVLEGLHVGARARLGAGAVLTHNLPAGCTAVGVPARVVRSDL